MLAELEAVLAAAGAGAERRAYAAAIVEANCLAKPTSATRVLSLQRLRELYGLDPRLPLFRVLRRLWRADAPARPLLAALAAAARDPLFAAGAPAVLALAPGEELPRAALRGALRDEAGDRLNDAVLDKVCRNAASSWTQSGHLRGRAVKIRRAVSPSPAAAAFALFLARAAGFRGAAIFSSAWLRLLDCDALRARSLAVEARRAGLIDLRIAGDVVDLDTRRLDPAGA